MILKSPSQMVCPSVSVFPSVCLPLCLSLYVSNSLCLFSCPSVSLCILVCLCATIVLYLCFLLSIGPLCVCPLVYIFLAVPWPLLVCPLLSEVFVLRRLFLFVLLTLFTLRVASQQSVTGTNPPPPTELSGYIDIVLPPQRFHDHRDLMTGRLTKNFVDMSRMPRPNTVPLTKQNIVGLFHVSVFSLFQL